MAEQEARGEESQPDEQMAQSRSANQVQDEPIPASRHDDQKRPAAVVRNEESAAASAPEGRQDSDDAGSAV